MLKKFKTDKMEDKAKEIRFSIMFNVSGNNNKTEVAILMAKNEYKSNRELLFNLKSCGIIESDKVYLVRLQNLIDEENILIDEIKKLK